MGTKEKGPDAGTANEPSKASAAQRLPYGSDDSVTPEEAFVEALGLEEPVAGRPL